MYDTILPIYVVCDESYSMTDHMHILNAELRELYRRIRSDPLVNAAVRICLIGFADTARVVLPLSAIGKVSDVHVFGARAATNFEAAFGLLRETIERDMADLAILSCRIRQPTVFFLSDGQPTDPALWRQAHARLVDSRWLARPRVIAFGVGEADAATITSVGEYKAYLRDPDSTTPENALRRFAEAVTECLLLSGTENLTVRMPDKVHGFLPLLSDTT